MTYPPHGQQPTQGPYPQQPYGNGQAQQYGQPQPGYQGQPYPQQQPLPQGKQKPVQVRSVGKSVTKPAWTVGDIMWLICTAGLAYPIIWLKRRSKTTVTRHR